MNTTGAVCSVIIELEPTGKRFLLKKIASKEGWPHPAGDMTFGMSAGGSDLLQM